jgi:hypothetical protein
MVDSQNRDIAMRSWHSVAQFLDLLLDSMYSQSILLLDGAISERNI